MPDQHLQEVSEMPEKGERWTIHHDGENMMIAGPPTDGPVEVVRATPWRAGVGARMPPQNCTRNAHEDLAKAWAADTGEEAMPHIRSAVDWLRRALEQMEALDG